MVVPALRPEIFLFVEFPHKLIPLLLERHVLRVPLAYISGEHPEIAVGDERQRDPVKQIVSQKHDSRAQNSAAAAINRPNWSIPYLPCIKRINLSRILSPFFSTKARWPPAGC